MTAEYGRVSTDAATTCASTPNIIRSEKKNGANEKLGETQNGHRLRFGKGRIRVHVHGRVVCAVKTNEIA